MAPRKARGNTTRNNALPLNKSKLAAAKLPAIYRRFITLTDYQNYPTRPRGRPPRLPLTSTDEDGVFPRIPFRYLERFMTSTLEEMRDVLRANGAPTFGSRVTLFLRLVENDLIDTEPGTDDGSQNSQGQNNGSREPSPVETGSKDIVTGSDDINQWSDNFALGLADGTEINGGPGLVKSGAKGGHILVQRGVVIDFELVIVIVFVFVALLSCRSVNIYNSEIVA